MYVSLAIGIKKVKAQKTAKNIEASSIKFFCSGKSTSWATAFCNEQVKPEWIRIAVFVTSGLQFWLVVWFREKLCVNLNSYYNHS